MTKYNLTYSEDKRLKVHFVSLSELTQEYEIKGLKKDVFNKLDYDRKETPFGQDYYEGNAVIVYCDSEEKIEKAKQFLRKNRNKRVAIAVPRRPIDFFDAVFMYLAIRHIEDPNSNPDHKNYNSQELAQLNKLKSGAKTKLESLKNRYFSNKDLRWFGTEGKSLKTKENKIHDVANLIMEEVFSAKRNKIAHDHFNKVHHRISSAMQRVFKEAGDILADLNEPITIDLTWAANRGGMNYLKRCFVDSADLLSLLKSEGNIRYYQVEKDISKFKNKFPGYAHMLEYIPKLPNGKMALRPFLTPYYEEFGMGNISITLALLMVRRYYGDGIRFKREETAITDLNIQETSNILSLLEDQNSNAILQYQEISQEDKTYFSEVYNVFSLKPAQAGKNHSISEAFRAVKSWWDNQVRMVKSKVFFEKPYQAFVDAFNGVETASPYTFVKSTLLSLFNIESNEKINDSKLKEVIKGLELFKSECEQKLEKKESNIVSGFQSIFSAEGDTTEHAKDAILTWYESLDSLQKDKYSKFHNTRSKALIEHCRASISSIELMLFEKLPGDYGFGAIKDWGADYETDYLEAVIKAKEHIEKNRIKVSDPIIQFVGEIEEESGRLKYKGEVILEISPGKLTEVVFLTD